MEEFGRLQHRLLVEIHPAAAAGTFVSSRFNRLISKSFIFHLISSFQFTFFCFLTGVATSHFFFFFLILQAFRVAESQRDRFVSLGERLWSPVPPLTLLTADQLRERKPRDREDKRQLFSNSHLRTQSARPAGAATQSSTSHARTVARLPKPPAVDLVAPSSGALSTRAADRHCREWRGREGGGWGWKEGGGRECWGRKDVKGRRPVRTLPWSGGGVGSRTKEAIVDVQRPG